MPQHNSVKENMILTSFSEGLVDEQATEVQAWFVERRERSIAEKENTLRHWSVPCCSNSGSVKYLAFLTEALSLLSIKCPTQARLKSRPCRSAYTVFKSIYGSIMLQCNDRSFFKASQ